MKMRLYFKIENHRTAKAQVEKFIGKNNLNQLINELNEKIDKYMKNTTSGVLTDVYHHVNYYNTRISVRAKLVSNKELEERLAFN
jgi:hypothetical protein